MSLLGTWTAASMTRARIGALSIEVAEHQSGVSSAVGLNVVFHVDGRLVPNAFVGIRTGRLDRRANLLIMQAAVSKDRGDDRRWLLCSLLENAVAAADSHLRAKGHPDGLPEIRRVVQTLPRSLSE